MKVIKLKDRVLKPIIMLALPLFMVNCSSDDISDSEKEGLPYVTSFTITSSEQFNYPFLGKNVFEYDALGRITKAAVVGELEEITTFSDDGTSSKSIATLLKDGSVFAISDVTFNKDGRPIEYKSSNQDASISGYNVVSRYTYDEQGRLTGIDNTYPNATSDLSGLIKAYRMIYDAQSNRLIRVNAYKFDQDLSGKSSYCILKYLDEDNPVNFYPDNIFGSEARLCIPGTDGYSRDKLIDKIEFFDADDKKVVEQKYEYEFSSDNKLKSIKDTRYAFDGQGNVQPHTIWIKYGDLVY